MDKPLVSIIIPVYNRERQIVECLNKLCEQSYTNIETLIIDNDSSDDTFNVVEEISIHLKKLNIKMYKESRRGAAFARNLGLHHANGKYIQFLDSDDYLSVNKIENQVKAAELVSADFVYGDLVIMINQELEKKNKFPIKLEGYLSSLNSLQTMSPLIHNNSRFKNLLWNHELTNRQDIDYIFKIFLLSESYCYVPNSESYYVKHYDSRLTDSYKNVPFKILINSIIKFRTEYGHILDKRKLSEINSYLISLFNWASARNETNIIMEDILKYGFLFPWKYRNLKNNLKLVIENEFHL